MRRTHRNTLLGTLENDAVFCIVTFVILMIPYLGLAASLILYFIPGKITGGYDFGGQVAEGTSNIFQSISPKKDATSQIKELHELKKDGALSEEEYVQAKEKILKRVA